MAKRSARSPSHGVGKRNPKSARLGIVCRMFVPPRMGFRSHALRLTRTPNGTPITTAIAIATPTSHKCSSVSVKICPRFLLKNSSMSVGQCCLSQRLCVLHHTRIGRSHEFLFGKDADEFAGFEQGDASAEMKGLCNIMSDHDDGLAQPLLHFEKLFL